MTKEKFLAILDANINQENLLKDLATEFLKEPLMAFKAKVEAGEVDLIPGVDMDKEFLLKAIDTVLAKI